MAPIATNDPWHKVPMSHLGLTSNDWAILHNMFRLHDMKTIVAPHLNPSKVPKLNLPTPCPFFELDTTAGSAYPDVSPFNLSTIHFGLQRLLHHTQPDVVMVPSYRMLLQAMMSEALSYAKLIVCTKVTNQYIHDLGWHRPWLDTYEAAGQLLIVQPWDSRAQIEHPYSWVFLFPLLSRARVLAIDVPASFTRVTYDADRNQIIRVSVSPHL